MLTPNQFKAIGWYAEQNDLRLSLSAPPYIFFRTRDGQLIQKDILTIKSLWERSRKIKEAN